MIVRHGHGEKTQRNNFKPSKKLTTFVNGPYITQTTFI